VITFAIARKAVGTDFEPVPFVTSRAGSLAEEEEEEEEEALGLMLCLGASE